MKKLFALILIIALLGGCYGDGESPTEPVNSEIQAMDDSIINFVGIYVPVYGRIDVKKRCKSLSFFTLPFTGAEVVYPKDAYSWRCTFHDYYGYKYWTEVDMLKACRAMYSTDKFHGHKVNPGYFPGKYDKNSTTWWCQAWPSLNPLDILKVSPPVAEDYEKDYEEIDFQTTEISETNQKATIDDLGVNSEVLKTSGIDVLGRCKSLDIFGVPFTGAEAVPPGDAYSWRCTFHAFGYKFWTEVDMLKACKAQHPGYRHYDVRPTNPKRVDSWVCSYW